MQYPIDPRVPNLAELPYTISYVLRKRIQVDGLHQLDKEKRPPDLMIWSGSPEQIDDWLERVVNPTRGKPKPQQFIYISESEVEGR